MRRTTPRKISRVGGVIGAKIPRAALFTDELATKRSAVGAEAPALSGSSAGVVGPGGENASDQRPH